MRIRQQSKLFHNNNNQQKANGTGKSSPSKKQSSTQTGKTTPCESKKSSLDNSRQLNKSLMETNELLKKRLSVRVNRSGQSELEMNSRQTEELLPKKSKMEEVDTIENDEEEKRPTRSESKSKKSKKPAQTSSDNEDNESVSSIKDPLQTVSLLTSAIAAMPISISTSASMNAATELEMRDTRTADSHNTTRTSTTSSSNNAPKEAITTANSTTTRPIEAKEKS